MKPKKKYYTHDPDTQGNVEILELIQTKGLYPLCKICGEPLVVALTPEMVQELKQPPGVRCPTDVRHFQTTANFCAGVDELWKELEDLM